MPIKRFLILCGVIAGIVVIIGGGYVFASTHSASNTSQTFPTEANAALNATIKGMNVPGIVISPQWKITATQLAPSPSLLSSQQAITSVAKTVWCVDISPSITIASEKHPSSITLSHFLVVQTTVDPASHWTAFTVDGAQSAQGKSTFVSIGCTNG